MKQGEKREETGTKQGAKLAEFKRRNGHIYSFVPADDIAAKRGGKCSYLRWPNRVAKLYIPKLFRLLENQQRRA
jgi:tRNA threonylcarbamoyladenosine modification (KEOPS) complex  Pcc1 subunit